MSSDSPVLLELRDLRKSFGNVRALDGVSFRLRKGEKITIIGPNGAGKTTLVNAISGYLRPESGSIIFNGIDITRKSPVERVKMGIVRSFQLVSVFNNLTVFENILASIISRKDLLRKPITPFINIEDAINEAEEILTLFGLDSKSHLYPLDLSQGDRKLLDIAVAFALRPSLLMLDEPTSGVATKEKHSIMAKIYEILDKTGTAGIVIEHDMDVVFKHSKRIVVMHQGKVLVDGDPEEIRKNDSVKQILMGEIYA
jgi:branched-chain amino acid transport system ATP-binding protein